ncbi:hypothetical protein J7M23_01065 [Candidatus Sumerlaeota bacterium]|nr:hypothetical protein [Candidatus Sumerlaeota bacterium]
MRRKLYISMMIFLSVVLLSSVWAFPTIDLGNGVKCGTLPGSSWGLTNDVYYVENNNLVLYFENDGSASWHHDIGIGCYLMEIKNKTTGSSENLLEVLWGPYRFEYREMSWWAQSPTHFKEVRNCGDHLSLITETYPSSMWFKDYETDLSGYTDVYIYTQLIYDVYPDRVVHWWVYRFDEQCVNPNNQWHLLGGLTFDQDAANLSDVKELVCKTVYSTPGFYIYDLYNNGEEPYAMAYKTKNNANPSDSSLWAFIFPSDWRFAYVPEYFDGVYQNIHCRQSGYTWFGNSGTNALYVDTGTSKSNFPVPGVYIYKIVMKCDSIETKSNETEDDDNFTTSVYQMTLNYEENYVTGAPQVVSVTMPKIICTPGDYEVKVKFDQPMDTSFLDLDVTIDPLGIGQGVDAIQVTPVKWEDSNTWVGTVNIQRPPVATCKMTYPTPTENGLHVVLDGVDGSEGDVVQETNIGPAGDKRDCIRTDIPNGNYYIYFIADPSMFSLWENDLMLILDYYDQARYQWGVHYESSSHNYYDGNYMPTVNCATTNSGQWKKAVFHLYNAYFDHTGIWNDAQWRVHNDSGYAHLYISDAMLTQRIDGPAMITVKGAKGANGKPNKLYIGWPTHIKLYHDFRSMPYFVALELEHILNIDGNLSDWELSSFNRLYEKITFTPESFTRIWGNAGESYGLTDASDFSANLYCYYDNDNLYVAVQVTDDDVRGTFTGDQLWRNDCLELWIDAKNDRNRFTEGLRATEDDAQINVDCNGNCWVYRTKNPDTVRTAISSAATLTANGYDIEVKIPFSTLGIDPSRGVGFTVSFCDNDGGVWTHLGIERGTAEQSPQGWGQLLFGRVSPGMSTGATNTWILYQ